MTDKATITALADQFDYRIRQTLTPTEYARAVLHNRLTPYPAGSCATHDFCDANMPMLEAFEDTTGREMVMDGDTPEADADLALWSMAWADWDRRYCKERVEGLPLDPPCDECGKAHKGGQPCAR